MASREYAMVCIESAYGVSKTSPVLGTDKFYLKLSEGEFVGEMDPLLINVPYGGGRTSTSESIADQYETKGTLTTILYPGLQSNLLLGWAITPINSGRTTPWVTTDASSLMPPGDLASLSFYHAWQFPDASYILDKYTGCKCLDWSLDFVETGDGRKLVFRANWQGIKVAANTVDSTAAPNNTEFPAPAEANYPTGPWLFSHLGKGSGTATVGGVNRTQLESLSLKATNAMSPKYYQSNFIQLLRFCGRQATVDAGLRLIVSPNDLSAYQSLTASTMSFVLDNGTHALTIDYATNNRISKHQRKLPMNVEFSRMLSLKSVWDPASSFGDLAVSQT